MLGIDPVGAGCSRWAGFSYRKFGNSGARGGRGYVWGATLVAMLLPVLGLPLYAAPVSAATGWAIVASPKQTSTENYTLSSIACPATNMCWAVGNYDTSSTDDVALVEEYNGSAWSIVSTPTVSSTSAVLTGVACVSTSFCLAVGYYYNGSYDMTLSEEYLGSTWSVVYPTNGTTSGNNV